MPIYEYVCAECKTHFEVLMSSTSPETVRCKKCNSIKVNKTISAASFRMNHSRPSIPSGALSGCSSKSGFG